MDSLGGCCDMFLAVVNDASFDILSGKTHDTRKHPRRHRSNS